MPQPVRHFRQILIWPLQVMPIREGAQIQEPWDLLLRTEGEHAWRELQDEFGCDASEFKERHYSEFVTFLPYVRKFLYGEGKGRGKSTGVESPIRVYRRSDIAKVRKAVEQRQAAVPHFLRCAWRAGQRGRFRATGQDDALRAELRDLRRVVVPRPDFAVHAEFADAARDELRVLRTEVEDEDLVAMDVVGHGGP